MMMRISFDPEGQVPVQGCVANLTCLTTCRPTTTPDDDLIAFLVGVALPLIAHGELEGSSSGGQQQKIATLGLGRGTAALVPRAAPSRDPY